MSPTHNKSGSGALAMRSLHCKVNASGKDMLEETVRKVQADWA
jgi:hypothetical protein